MGTCFLEAIVVKLVSVASSYRQAKVPLTDCLTKTRLREHRVNRICSLIHTPKRPEAVVRRTSACSPFKTCRALLAFGSKYQHCIAWCCPDGKSSLAPDTVKHLACILAPSSCHVRRWRLQTGRCQFFNIHSSIAPLLDDV